MTEFWRRRARAGEEGDLVPFVRVGRKHAKAIRHELERRRAAESRATARDRVLASALLFVALGIAIAVWCAS